MISSVKPNEIDWQHEYLQIIAYNESLLNRLLNQSKRINELLRIIAQHEQIKEEDAALEEN